MEKLKTILIVDDDESTIALIAQEMQHIYNIKIADNPSNIDTILEKFQIDVILLDVLMPETSGFEVAQKLKENIQTSHIPFIFVSSLHDEKFIEKGIELGACGFLTKPLDMNKLNDTIIECLER